MEPLAFLSLIFGLLVVGLTLFYGYVGIILLFAIRQTRRFAISVSLAGLSVGCICGGLSFISNFSLRDPYTLSRMSDFFEAMLIGFGIGSAVAISIGLPIYLIYRLYQKRCINNGVDGVDSEEFTEPPPNPNL